MNATVSQEADLERLARRRAGAKMGWYIHATVFVLVNLGMFALSYSGFTRRPWSMAPVLGWGAGLLLHGISVFILATGSPLRERMLQRERDRLQREQQDRAGRR